MRDNIIQERLKQMRSNTGMTQKNFAAKFDIPVSTYEQWEMGMRTPPTYIVDMIATILLMENDPFKSIDVLIDKITQLPTQENAEGQDMYQAYDVLRTIKEYGKE